MILFFGSPFISAENPIDDVLCLMKALRGVKDNCENLMSLMIFCNNNKALTSLWGSSCFSADNIQVACKKTISGVDVVGISLLRGELIFVFGNNFSDQRMA